MGLISNLTLEQLKDLQARIARKARQCDSLEEAAQSYMTILYEELTESIILARFFATLPFGSLPEPNKEFVKELCESTEVSHLLSDETLVLSLLGSRGIVPEWNDRRHSKGHVGIPLVSADFIDAIPMMARLLRQLGLKLEWIDAGDTELVVRHVGEASGIFHVQNARTEVDIHGQKIIAARDFVEKYGVETVFGIGGAYLGSPMIFTAIVFNREPVQREIAERFMLQASKFKTATLRLVDEEKIFT